MCDNRLNQRKLACYQKQRNCNHIQNLHRNRGDIYLEETPGRDNTTRHRKTESNKNTLSLGKLQAQIEIHEDKTIHFTVEKYRY